MILVSTAKPGDIKYIKYIEYKSPAALPVQGTLACAFFLYFVL